MGSSNCDLLNQFDHIIWAGDLNYRQEKREWWWAEDIEQYNAVSAAEHELAAAPTSEEAQKKLATAREEFEKLAAEPAAVKAMDSARFGGEKATVSKADKLDDIKYLMARRDWKQLKDNDELVREMSAGRVFAGFADSLDWQADVGGRGMIPTFKMQRKKIWSQLSQRVPSFCDRILYRSAPGAAECLELDSFAAAPSLVTSDHKPVSARFKLTIPPPMPRLVNSFLAEHRAEGGDIPLDHVSFAAIR